MRVLLIDDHPIFRQGLSMLLTHIDPELVVEHLSSPKELSSLLERQQGVRFDLAILDLNMPGLQGTEALELFRDTAPDLPVVVLSGDERPDTVKACIDLGACGFVSKSDHPDVLPEAMTRVLGGGVWLPGSSLQVVSTDTSPQPLEPRHWSGSQVRLTARQRDVLHGVVQGKTNKVIARELGISDGTVKTHLAHLMALLAVNTRTQLVYELARQGLKIDELGSPG